MISEETGSAYGLGTGVVFAAATGCVLIASHAGAEPGYGSNFFYYPATGAVFAILGNGNGNGDGGTGDAVQEVTNALNPLLQPVLMSSNEPGTAPWG